VTGRLEVLVPEAEWDAREVATCDMDDSHWGCGRELFAPFRAAVGAADAGATIFG
jgi:phosphogluconate dehydratase